MLSNSQIRALKQAGYSDADIEVICQYRSEVFELYRHVRGIKHLNDHENVSARYNYVVGSNPKVTFEMSGGEPPIIKGARPTKAASKAAEIDCVTFINGNWKRKARLMWQFMSFD